MDEQAARQRFETAIAGHEPAFQKFFLARFLDLSFEYEPGVCRIRFPVSDFLFNPQGSLHGGIIATIMDVSMGHLLKNETDASGTTLEMKTQYLRPLLRGEAVCEARVLRLGGRICTMESRLTDCDGALAAHATATWMRPRPAG